MRILVIGKGAREDAFVWKLLRNAHDVFAAPGNPGMEARGAKCFYHIADNDIDALLRLVGEIRFDLIVVGPEGPLALGIVDRFEKIGIPIVGPTKAAAELETSKAWAKWFMTRHGIPTSPFLTFDDPDDAKDYLSARHDPFLVVKADGLAAGKGVIVAETVDEALAAVDRMMVKKEFGDAGKIIVIEQRISGTECSAIALSDGDNVVPFKKAKDWKRRFDGDQGPNTGSMGGVCPAYDDPKLDERIMETIMRPVIEGMKREGRPFRGFLYAGLMLTADGPKVVEFNVRFGDPEACVIIPMLADKVDFGEFLLRSTEKDGLKNAQLSWRSGYAVCPVAVVGAYPGDYEKGYPITGIKRAEEEGSLVFHAGTKKVDGRLVTDGGRVVDIVGRRLDLADAKAQAYKAIAHIKFETSAYRTDIGDGL